MKVLNDLREKYNLSISSLVVNLNNNYGKDFRICQIWDWENGYRSVSENDIAILADYFNVSKQTFNA